MCVGMHWFSLSLFGIPDSHTLTHFPSIHCLDLFLPYGRTHFHTSSAEKVGPRRMCLFINTGTAWIFQRGNMIPQCQATQWRGLWVNLGWSEQRWNLRLEHGFRAPPAQRDRHTDEATELVSWWRIGWTLSHHVCVHWCQACHWEPRLAVENHKYKPRHVPALLIVCVCQCVDGKDGCACGHTRHSRDPIKPNWRWGIKLGCAEWYLGSWEFGTEKFKDGWEVLTLL